MKTIILCTGDQLVGKNRNNKESRRNGLESCLKRSGADAVANAFRSETFAVTTSNTDTHCSVEYTGHNIMLHSIRDHTQIINNIQAIMACYNVENNTVDVYKDARKQISIPKYARNVDDEA